MSTNCLHSTPGSEYRLRQSALVCNAPLFRLDGQSLEYRARKFLARASPIVDKYSIMSGIPMQEYATATNFPVDDFGVTVP